MLIAIQPDDYGTNDASAPRWAEALEQAGYSVRYVNVYRADILQQLEGCQGFMWRWGHTRPMRQIATKLLPVLERILGLVTYPDQSTCWHYDDKIAQAYLLEALKIPIPRTWVWNDADAARSWAAAAMYPVVLKLSSGAGSTNVRLLRSSDEAFAWIDRLFGPGVETAADEEDGQWGGKLRLRAAAKALIKGQPLDAPHSRPDLHHGYLLCQEFLEGNAYDTRITVIGHRAFGFRRFNREGDFRASGSGKINWDPTGIDESFVRLAFHTANKLGSQSCAIDGLWRGEEPTVGEVSYTYASWAVQKCPGHWELDGTPENGRLRWVEGPMWPEEAQVTDFIERLKARASQMARMS